MQIDTNYSPSSAAAVEKKRPDRSTEIPSRGRRCYQRTRIVCLFSRPLSKWFSSAQASFHRLLLIIAHKLRATDHRSRPAIKIHLLLRGATDLSPLLPASSSTFVFIGPPPGPIDEFPPTEPFAYPAKGVPPPPRTGAIKKLICMPVLSRAGAGRATPYCTACGRRAYGLHQLSGKCVHRDVKCKQLVVT